jgi:hypothetical protein
MVVNHKRVAQVLREDDLLGMQPRTFVVTTDSEHELEVYLNLASRMKLTGVNQLWVPDITYIRLKAEFVYLAVLWTAIPGRWWDWHWNERWPAGYQRWLWNRRLRNGSRRQVWSIIPIVACNMHLVNM